MNGKQNKATGESASYMPALAQVVEVRRMTVTEEFFRLKLADDQALGHRPGQFVQLSVFGVGEVPISICSSPTRTPEFELCIRAAGDVTNKLHEVQPGDYVGIRGPYGRGFPLDEMTGRDILVIAGGIGIAPLRSLIQYVLDSRKQFGRFRIIFGAKDPASLLFKDDLQQWRTNPQVELTVTVDRPDSAWKGRTGTLLLPVREMEIHADNSLVVAAVGPPAMYRFVAVELFRKGMNERQKIGRAHV